jgi:hypothetical protein
MELVEQVGQHPLDLCWEVTEETTVQHLQMANKYLGLMELVQMGQTVTTQRVLMGRMEQ